MLAYAYPFRKASESLIEAVWKKGRPIPEYDPAQWRWDICGNVMRRRDHGKAESKFGWEIDHELPTSKGGGDNLENLQPLHWQNNRRKGDNYPWRC